MSERDEQAPQQPEDAEEQKSEERVEDLDVEESEGEDVKGGLKIDFNRTLKLD
jgi:hypothetical protein